MQATPRRCSDKRTKSIPRERERERLSFFRCIYHNFFSEGLPKREIPRQGRLYSEFEAAAGSCGSVDLVVALSDSRVRWFFFRPRRPWSVTIIEAMLQEAIEVFLPERVMRFWFFCRYGGEMGIVSARSWRSLCDPDGLRWNMMFGRYWWSYGFWCVVWTKKIILMRQDWNFVIKIMWVCCKNHKSLFIKYLYKCVQYGREY